MSFATFGHQFDNFAILFNILQLLILQDFAISFDTFPFLNF